MTNYKRSKLHTTKHQRPIIMVTMVPSLVFCVILSAFILFFHNEMIRVVTKSSAPPSVNTVHLWSIYMIGILWMFFFVFLSWSFSVSSNIVGAFERIIRELDKIIGGGTKRPIIARTHDDLANELLKRINILISRTPAFKKDEE